MSKERLEGINKLKNFINSLDDSADADDFHKFVDTCQINYEEGTFNEILRFMQSQAERVQELEQKNDRLKQEADFWRVEDREMMRLSHENKLYQEAMQELKEYLESTIPKIPTNEKPLILTKSLEIINRATEGD